MPLSDLLRMDILRLKGIGMEFEGRWILRDVNFSMRRGEFAILSGPNGSGKTTLLRIMLRLLKPTCGRVEYLNSEGVRVKRLRIGYLPQKSKIDTRFPITVRETVLSGLRSGFLGRLPADADARLSRIAEEYGIEEYLESPIRILSGGQLQRTLLARAVISNPELLILDEPLSYIDKRFEERFYHHLERLKGKMTILLVSHELTKLVPIADRVVELTDHHIFPKS